MLDDVVLPRNLYALFISTWQDEVLDMSARGRRCFEAKRFRTCMKLVLDRRYLVQVVLRYIALVGKDDITEASVLRACRHYDQRQLRDVQCAIGCFRDLWLLRRAFQLVGALHKINCLQEAISVGQGSERHGFCLQEL